jgi:hypothetical protein
MSLNLSQRTRGFFIYETIPRTGVPTGTSPFVAWIRLPNWPRDGHTAQTSGYQTPEAWRLVDCRWIYLFNCLKQILKAARRNQREGHLIHHFLQEKSPWILPGAIRFGIPATGYSISSASSLPYQGDYSGPSSSLALAQSLPTPISSKSNYGRDQSLYMP